MFGQMRDRQNYPPYGKDSGERFLTEQIGLSALGGVERAEHPARNQPPSVGGSVRRPQVPPRRGRFCLESMADEVSGRRQVELQPPKSA